MAVVVPYVKNAAWVDGSTVATAAKANIWEDGIFNAHLQPAVHVFHNANQTITTSTTTALAFNSERFDTAGGTAAAHHDTVTNNSRLTALYAGKYLITANVDWGVSAPNTGVRQSMIRLNGTTVIAQTMVGVAGASSRTTTNVTTIYDLAVNDYVEVTVFHDAGANCSVAVSSNFSPEFSMVRVA